MEKGDIILIFIILIVILLLVLFIVNIDSFFPSPAPQKIIPALANTTA